MPEYQSRCHCNAVALKFILENGITEPYRCNCSICRRKNAVMHAVDRDQLVVIKGDTLREYQFNTNTARHYFCSVCGIYTHHQRRINADELGVNLGCVDGLDLGPYADIPVLEGANHPSDTQNT